MGYDAAKKVKGRKRHAVVDTLGLMLGCAILPGNVQDRDGCLGVLRQVRLLFPFLERVIADGAYQGRETARAVRRAARAKLEIVKRSDAAKGFVVLQKRWIVERTFGWLGRCRRLAKDFEALTRSHLAFVQLAMIRLMLRRLARASRPVAHGCGDRNQRIPFGFRPTTDVASPRIALLGYKPLVVHKLARHQRQCTRVGKLA